MGVDHSTIYRWVQKYAPEIEKRLRWQWRRPQSTSWRVDETYVKVRGQVGLSVPGARQGRKHDRLLSLADSEHQGGEALPRQSCHGLKFWEKPQVINTDKAPTYGIAISELKAEGKCLEETVHRQVKYLNNVIEADHGKLKQLIRPVRGFKTLKTAYATIMGFEVSQVETRERLSQSAVDGFFAIIDKWKLNMDTAGELLGGVPRSGIYRFKTVAGTLRHDELTRISYLIGIYKALHILLPAAMADQWMTRPNDNPLFRGSTPLQYALRVGLPGLHQIRGLLDKARRAAGGGL